MKTAIVAVLILCAGVSPWTKAEPVLPPAPVPEVTATVSTEVEEVAVVETAEAEKEWHIIQNCTITHYCHGVCCNGTAYAYKPLASGAWPEAGRSVAVDRSIIPLGSEVMINGHVYIAEDTGVRGNHVDIFCDSHSEALERGMYKTTVQWRAGGRDLSRL